VKNRSAGVSGLFGSGIHHLQASGRMPCQIPRGGSTLNRPPHCPDQIRSCHAPVDVIVYVDTSDVREGALEELKSAMKELVDFVEANEPQIIAYNVYLSDDGSRMTVVHVHPDSESLEYHMEVAGPVFRRSVGLVTLSSIHIYGDPSETALRQLHEKARLLGRGAVVVDAVHAGFTRFAIR
jgi:hypothetical protein